MSTTKNVVISAVIAAAIAITLVSAAILSPGLLGSKSLGSGTTVPSGMGTLAVMLTDPPTVPNGVTALYATYNNLEVHVSDAGNQSGWYNLNSSGQINLMSIVNISQTISSSNLPSGRYNALRFNITSAIVTYNGANYTALMVENAEGTHILTIPIVGGVQVSSQTTSDAVIDLTPTVLLLGNPSSPTFAFIGAATAYTLPAQSIPRSSFAVGQQFDLNRVSTFIQHTTRFEISAVTLTPNSLSVTVENTGNASIVFRLVSISATTSQHGGFQPLYSNSAVFAVEANQSLTPLSGTRLQLVQTVAAAGFLVAPGESATFTFSGPITLGQLLVTAAVVSPPNGQGTAPGPISTPPPQTSQSPQPITSGQKYIVSVQGDGFLAQTAVIAGSS